VKKEIPEIRKDINYYKKVRDFLALDEEEKKRLALEFFEQKEYLDLKLDEVVEIINKTKLKSYENEEDWTKWLV